MYAFTPCPCHCPQHNNVFADSVDSGYSSNKRLAADISPILSVFDLVIEGFLERKLIFVYSVVLGIDPLLGRLDCASFSQQAFMKPLIGGFEDTAEEYAAIVKSQMDWVTSRTHLSLT